MRTTHYWVFIVTVIPFQAGWSRLQLSQSNIFNARRVRRRNSIITGNERSDTSLPQGQRGKSKLHNLSRCHRHIIYVLAQTWRRPWGACLWAFGMSVFVLLVGPGEPLSRAADVINNKWFQLPLQTESTLKQDSRRCWWRGGVDPGEVKRNNTTAMTELFFPKQRKK